jgi:hypothetical protein
MSIFTLLHGDDFTFYKFNVGPNEPDYTVL